MNVDLPLGRGRKLHLHGYTRDDRERERLGRKERAPSFAWWLSATVQGRPEPRPPMDDIAARKAWAVRSERHIGTISKGWVRLGWSRYRFKTVKLEFAIGGEDGMLQWSVRTPIVSWAFGAKLPQRWVERWIYERREWSIHFGYIGSIARIEFAFDEKMSEMRDYYQRKVEANEEQGPHFPTRAERWPGWGFYLGGTSVWERQVMSRIFGGRAYSSKKDEPVAVVVRMPEGEYDATVTLMEETWQRPRAFWCSRRQRASEITLEAPPKYAGKGENSWDCGDDASYSTLSRSELTVEDAVRAYEVHVLERRRRYGEPSAPAAV